MTSNPRTAWIRVSRRDPCPVCGKPDWCLVSADGSACICTRNESRRRAGLAGFLHRLGRRGLPARPVQVRPPAPAPDPEELVKMLDRFRQTAQTMGKLPALAEGLGVSLASLERLRVGWSPAGFSAWPMADSAGQIVGINRRWPDGNKKLHAGHKAGLYLPTDLPAEIETLLVCEGGSDTAAALSLGFAAVGRFSCLHGAGLLSSLLRRLRCRRLAIVADQDPPGQRGAADLTASLLPYAREVRVVTPPLKDLRCWLRAGATAADVRGLIEAAPLCTLEVVTR